MDTTCQPRPGQAAQIRRREHAGFGRLGSRCRPVAWWRDSLESVTPEVAVRAPSTTPINPRLSMVYAARCVSPISPRALGCIMGDPALAAVSGSACDSSSSERYVHA